MSELLITLLTAAGVVAGIGLLCALLLTVSSKFLSVKEDERVQKIRGCLPGANCGACGFAGCDGYADAIVNSEGVKTNLCVPGGEAVAKNISEIMGVDFENVDASVAFVQCNGNCSATSKRFDYNGITTCSAASLLYGGDGKCSYGCLGFGDCAAACPTDSICIENGIAHIDPRSCIGCGICTERCPKHLIALRSVKKPVYVSCSNKKKGALARKECKNSCIGCKRCENSCHVGAIKVTDNLARVDYEKCIGCKKCSDICPMGCISVCENETEKN